MGGEREEFWSMTEAPFQISGVQPEAECFPEHHKVSSSPSDRL